MSLPDLTTLQEDVTQAISDAGGLNTRSTLRKTNLEATQKYGQ